MQSARVVNIQDLIYTTNFVSDSVSVREVKIWFHTQPNVRSLAVATANGKYGIITREKLNASLIESGGTSDFLAKPAATIMDSEPYVVKAEASIQEVMEALVSLRRNEESFFEDILVCDTTDKFIGLVSVRDIAVDQFIALMHRLTAMEAQQAALARQNKELFENSFRQSQSETQFRSYFDHSPIPMIIFTREGKCLTANRRFCQLAHIAHRQLDGRVAFEKVFAQSFQDAVKLGADSSDVSSYHVLDLKMSAGEVMPVQAMIEVSPDWGHLVISIMSLEEKSDEPQAKPSGESVLEPVGRSPGKITQAIQNKLNAKSPTPLARSVASNLIDREEQVDRLMKKLEQIFSVATQVEQHPSTEPISSEEVVDQRQHMKGHIAEFSVVDLCQIIIQGTKTGQLLIHEHSEEELTAYIYFYCGTIVHAKHRDGLEGEEALPHIVSTKTGTFDFIFNKATPKTTIQGSAMGLLMEACRKADESAAH